MILYFQHQNYLKSIQSKFIYIYINQTQNINRVEITLRSNARCERSHTTSTVIPLLRCKRTGTRAYYAKRVTQRGNAFTSRKGGYTCAPYQSRNHREHVTGFDAIVWRPFLLLVRITALARVASAESIFPDYSSDYSSSNKSIIPRWDDVVKFYRENYFASLERGENFSVWRALLCCVDFICAFLWLSSRFYRTPRETSSPSRLLFIIGITFSNVSVSWISSFLLFFYSSNEFIRFVEFWLLLLLEGIKFVKCRIENSTLETCSTDLFDWPKEIYDHRG